MYEKLPWPRELMVQYRIIKAEAQKANTLVNEMIKYAFDDERRMTGMVDELLPVLMSCLDEITIRADEANSIQLEGRRPNWVVQVLRQGGRFASLRQGNKCLPIIAAANKEEWPIVEALLENLKIEIVNLRKAIVAGEAPSYSKHTEQSQDTEQGNVLPFVQRRKAS